MIASKIEKYFLNVITFDELVKFNNIINSNHSESELANNELVINVLDYCFSNTDNIQEKINSLKAVVKNSLHHRTYKSKLHTHDYSALGG